MHILSLSRATNVIDKSQRISELSQCTLSAQLPATALVNTCTQASANSYKNTINGLICAKSFAAASCAYPHMYMSILYQHQARQPQKHFCSASLSGCGRAACSYGHKQRRLIQIPSYMQLQGVLYQWHIFNYLSHASLLHRSPPS